LGDLHRVLPPDALPRLDPLVVVVDRDGERPLGRVLTDDVLLQEVEDLLRLGQLAQPEVAGLGQLLLDDLVAQVDALVADVHAGARDQLLDLLLALPAEGALQQVAALTHSRHAPDATLPDRRTTAYCAHGRGVLRTVRSGRN